MSDLIRVELGRARLDKWPTLLKLAEKVKMLQGEGYDILSFYDYVEEEKHRYLVYHVFFKTESEAAIFKLTHT